MFIDEVMNDTDSYVDGNDIEVIGLVGVGNETILLEIEHDRKISITNGTADIVKTVDPI